MLRKKESIPELRRRLQDKGAGRWYSDWTEYIPRKFSIYFTKVFVFLHISANQITLLSIILGIFTAIFLSFSTPLFIAIGAFVLFFVPVFDCSDGEVSRYHGAGSCTGEYFDRSAGAIIDPLILFAIGLSVFSLTSNKLDIVAGFIGGFFLVLTRLSVAHIYLCAFSDVTNFSINSGKKSVETNVNMEKVVDVPKFAKKIAFIEFIGDLFFVKTWGLIYWIWFAGIVSFLSLFLPLNAFILEILRPLIWLYAIVTPFAVMFIVYKTLKNKTPEKLLKDLTMKR